MTTYPSLDDIACCDRRVLLRVDMNAPTANGVVTDDTRIQRVIPTILRIRETGGRVILVSHRGRPTPGQCTEKDTLAPIAKRLSDLLGEHVPLIATDFNEALPDHPILLVENSRCLLGETDNDEQLAKRMAQQCDVFVMDAFATAHRAHASCDAIARYAKDVCIGPLFAEEMAAIERAMTQPKRPFMAMVGGAKVSTKLPLLKQLITQVDILIVGGGIANTLLAASGKNIGASLHEADFIELAKELLEQAKALNVTLPLPSDAVVTQTIDAPETAETKSIDAINPSDIIVDIGPNTQQHYADLIQQAGTVVWNGPVGIFEIPAYANGTKAVCTAIAESSAYSLAGGGDTLAALALFDKTAGMSYVSTGGGALLAVLQGQTLPILATLDARRNP